MAEPPQRDGTSDPTLNVRENLADAVERQDDLRRELQRYFDTRVEGMVKLSEDRVEAVHREFENIERRRIEHKNDTKIAVDAAFTAAKEAVKEQAAASDKAISKSEGTVSGQIKAVEGTVDDLKDRIGKLETQQQTKSETRVDSRASTGVIVAVVAAVFTFLLILIAAAGLIVTLARG
jgi:hypothetical protein